MAAERPAYPMLRLNGSSPSTEVALVVNGAMQGRTNNVIDFDIPADATSVVLQDERLHEFALLVTGLGSTVVSALLAPGQVTLAVEPGLARVERLGVLG
jgi:hypothetical protein